MAPANVRSRLRRLVRKARGRGVPSAAGLPGRFEIRLPFPPSAEPRPRHGYGRPPYPRLNAIIRRGEPRYEQHLEDFAALRADLAAIPLENEAPGEPFWRNMLMFGIDGASLYCFVRRRAPRRYIEVGSGNSTLFVDRARRDGDRATEIVSLDPSPRREIDAICDRVVREPLESTDLSVFAEVQAGDVVFLDGTHRVFMNSDATVFFCEVLPELPPGVLVGIHDIHLPDDYRPEHAERYYSEQYLLAAYLLAESPWLTLELPCWYVSHHPRLSQLANSLLPAAFLTEPPPQAGRAPDQHLHGVICWLSTGPRQS
jgi:hypothetical protein